MNVIRSRILTINVEHNPTLHRRWPLMLLRGARGVAVCWRGRIYGIGLLPRFRDGVA